MLRLCRVLGSLGRVCQATAGVYALSPGFEYPFPSGNCWMLCQDPGHEDADPKFRIDSKNLAMRYLLFSGRLHASIAANMAAILS